MNYYKLNLNDKIRHGFEKDYSETFLTNLANNFYIYYDDKRHNTNGNPLPQELASGKYYQNYQPILDWKIMKERQKTISAIIMLCLNLGVDPPDVMKTYPCAKLESWIDPSNFNDTKKAIELIGKNLQSQYENLTLRTKYKLSLDPSVEDVKRFCNTLRRNAKDERILFHYNGHGVPQPTSSGEIWVFNRGYTQYIPISLYDLQTWLGAPVIFVYDCNSAGHIVHNFKKFVQKRIDDDNDGNHDVSAPSPTSAYLDCIQLAACKSNELLAMNPELPADLFTCCLTCPIDISVKWFIMQSPLKKNYYSQLPTNSIGNVVIPGKLTERRTPLGELNWIFTAITDTIAWTSLSRPIFKRLFRQDLMVAALFRNFLLAKRIMPILNCNPISDPPLPETIRFHKMWDSWDLAIDQVLCQLIKEQNQAPSQSLSIPQQQIPQDSAPQTPQTPQVSLPQTPQAGQLQSQSNNTSQMSQIPSQLGQNQLQIAKNYQHSTFFEQQLTAFEIWLKYSGPSVKSPPEQLPIVLQVLLSQVHRLRALILLSRFLDLGPWAVYLSLSIGIFPYVLKLLQSPAQELKPVLIFIWARIMAIDYKSTQQELCKDKGYNYFYQILNSPPHHNGGMIINDDHKAMSAFILTLFIKDFKNGQRLCFSIELINNCIKFISSSENPLLRQWCCLLLSQLWANYPDGKWIIYKDGYLQKLCSLVNDPIPEVRTSVILAITAFLSDTSVQPTQSQAQQLLQQHNNTERKDELKQQDLKLANLIVGLISDGSPMVRKQIVFFISKFTLNYSKFFLVVAFNQLQEEIMLIDQPNNLNEFRKNSPAYGSIFSSIWKALLILSEDPHLEVKQLSEMLIDSIMIKLNQSELGPLVKEMQNYLLSRSSINIESFQPVKPVEIKVRNATDSRLISRNNNVLTISGGPGSPSGGAAATRAASAGGFGGGPRSVSSASSTTISSPLKFFSKFIKSLHNEETDTFSILQNNPEIANYAQQDRPKPPRFSPRDLSQFDLPPDSGFFDYSVEYFQEPQMSNSEVDEPGSKSYVERLWRRNRNESIIQQTQTQKQLAIRGHWSKHISLNNSTQPKLVKFTQFEKILVASDERDNVSVWDWEANSTIRKFSNLNPVGTKITDMKFLNEDDLPLLLIGSSDGVIKIYKNFHKGEDEDEEDQIQLVSAFRALPDLLLTSKSSGLISEWQQSRGSLLVSGDVKIIKIWDAPRELCLVDIPARSTSSITAITSDQVAGDIFVSGFDDGSIRVYDRRLDARESMVRTWQPKAKRSSVRNIHMQRGGYRELASGWSDGTVSLWDLRNDEPVVSFNTPEKSARCFEIHEHAPIITTGSKVVNLYTTSGDLLSTIKNQDSYLRPGYLSSISLHPHRMMMATNYVQDSRINVYVCEDGEY